MSLLNRTKPSKRRNSDRLRESLFWFPALNVVHLMGLTIAGGTIVFWDLRLLGVGLRRAPVSQVGASLLPWTWAGFAIMFVSGSMLVTIEAGRLYSNIFFRMKILFLILAGLNVLVFHRTVSRSVPAWDQAHLTGAGEWLAVPPCCGSASRARTRHRLF